MQKRVSRKIGNDTIPASQNAFAGGRMEYVFSPTPRVFARSLFVDRYGVEMPRDVETSM